MSDDSDPHTGIEAELAFLYPDGETELKIKHRKRLFDANGEVNVFQRRSLTGMVLRKRDEDAAPPPPQSAPSSLPAVTPDLAADIPEPVEGYEDRVDVVGMVKAACTIITAVANWGKPQGVLKREGRTEGIHVRCPFPAHIDNNPSAWINTAKDTWFCGACQEGGDQLDFYAAAKHGLHPQDWHNKDDFPRIIREMAEELGIDPDPPVAPPPDPVPDDPPDAVYVAPEPDVPPAPDNEAPSAPPEPSIAVLDPDPEPDMHDPLAVSGMPRYDWPDLDYQRGTFLHEWMVGNEEDMYWVAPEYFILLGLQALALCCGHNLQPMTNLGRTNSALMLVLVGPTGCGKSEAKHRMTRMFRSHAGSRWDARDGSGIKMFPTPGSPEALLATIRHDIEDPSDPLARIETQTTALLEEDEFTSYISKMTRKGGEHGRQKTIKIYDFTKHDPVEREEVDHDFAKTSGHSDLHDSFFCATFLTQTESVRRQIEENDMRSGFMNRIIPVFGNRRMRPDPTVSLSPDDPIYFPAWRRTWDRIRRNPLCTLVPWAAGTGHYLKKHEYWEYLDNLDQRDDVAMLSRLKHHACRIAFLLAVNEDSPVVEPRHFEVALRFLKGYLQPCYGMFEEAAKATESKDIKEKLLDWIEAYYLRTAKFPERRLLGQQRFWRSAPDFVQSVALDNLVANNQIQIPILRDNGRLSPTLILTGRNDHWAKYVGYHGKTFEKAAFYANT